MAYRVATVGKGTIYAMPCPVKGQLESVLGKLRAQGVSRIVSLLEPVEADKLGAGQEAELCQQVGLSYQNYPIKDFATAENQSKFVGFIDELYQLLLAGENIVVHCYAGIGRTGLTIGSILIRHGVPAKDAMDLMSEARGRNMPQTQEQYEYLLEFEERSIESVGRSRFEQKSTEEKKSWFRKWLG